MCRSVCRIKTPGWPVHLQHSLSHSNWAPGLGFELRSLWVHGFKINCVNHEATKNSISYVLHDWGMKCACVLPLFTVGLIWCAGLEIFYYPEIWRVTNEAYNSCCFEFIFVQHIAISQLILSRNFSISMNLKLGENYRHRRYHIGWMFGFYNTWCKYSGTQLFICCAFLVRHLSLCRSIRELYVTFAPNNCMIDRKEDPKGVWGWLEDG